MIGKGSRYAQSGTYTVVDAQGRELQALRPRIAPPTPAEFRHTMRTGERLDLLAAHYYRKPDRFWRIADANSELDADRLLEPGRQLLVPPDDPR